MRDTLLHLVVFLLIFAVSLLFISACAVLWEWGTTYSPELQRQPGWLSAAAPNSLARCFAVSLAISLFLILGRLKHRPGNSFVSLFLLLVLSTFLLMLGIQITTDLAGPPGRSRQAPGFVSRTIHRTDGGRVYVETVKGGTDTRYLGGGSQSIAVEGIAVHTEKGIQFSKSAFVKVSSGDYGTAITVVPDDESSSAFTATPVNPIYGPALAMPPLFGGWVHEINLLNDYFLTALRGSQSRLLLASFSLCVFILGGRFFFRLSRWPLFNVLLTLALFRGVFFTIGFLNSEIGNEILSLIPSSKITPDLLSIFYLLVGVLFITADLVLIKKPKSALRAPHD